MLDLLFPAQFFFLQNVLGLSLVATYGLEALLGAPQATTIQIPSLGGSLGKQGPKVPVRELPRRGLVSC